MPSSEAGHWLLHAVLTPALAWHVVGEPANKPKRNSGLASTSKIGLLRIYAKCVVGQDELAKRRISEALLQD